MPILIPSEKIYSIENSKILDNNIELVEQDLNNVIENEGNILSKEYTFNFYQYNENGALETLYKDLANNPTTDFTEGYKFAASTNDIGETIVTTTLFLTVDKNAYIAIGDYGDGVTRLGTHRLREISTIGYGQGIQKKELSRYEFPEVISYDPNFNIIELKYSVNILGNTAPLTPVLSTTISIEGQFITTGEAISQKTGNGNKTFSLPSNELIQKTNNNTSIIPQKVLSEYQNGKETAKILCSISEYYDENGNKVISTETSDKMVFNIYDEVVPTYNTPFGDAPLSLAKNGKPKSFKVLGSKAYFDGAVWQELTLQESGTFDGVISNGSKGLAYEEIDGKLYCTGIGTCTDTDITIASFVNGRRVYGIYEYAFSYNMNLETVVIREGVTTVGEGAFISCLRITHIHIPYSITNILSTAFYGCSNLTSVYITDIAAWCNINFGNGSSNPLYYAKNLYLNGKLITELVIPDGVTTIGKFAFSGCTTIISVVIPNSVTSIGTEAFYKCSNLNLVVNNSELPLSFNIILSKYGHILEYATILIDKYKNKFYKDNQNPESSIIYLDTPDGLRFKIDYEQYTLIEYIGNQYAVTLPTNILGNTYAIYKMRGAKRVILPNTFARINDYAFADSDIVSIDIPNSVTIIGNEAFSYCSNLTSVVIPDSVTRFGDMVFHRCGNLTRVVIGDGVTSIGSDAFSGCDSLTSVVIGDSVTEVGSYAFEYCASLTSVVIPNSVKTIYRGAFSGCNNLSQVYYGGTEEQWNNITIFEDNKPLINATIHFNSK